MQKLLKYWQKHLGLNDWFIELRDNSSPNDMILKNVAGECEYDEVNKTAVIRIISQNDYGNRVLPFDKEKTLVHELLHIKFWLIENSENELQNRFVHQLIEDFAKIMVELKRK